MMTMNEFNTANVYGMSVYSLASIDAPSDDVESGLFDKIFTPDYWNDGWNKAFAVYVRPKLYEIMGWTEPGRTFDSSLTLHIDEVREHLHSLRRHHITFSSYTVMDDGTVLIISGKYTTDDCDMTDPANITRYDEIVNMIRGGSTNE
ncbi:MAG: hypothetical protein NC114_06445 [Ruminococcus flavefaciens]|nr:hypothetical protein [Ruminococcus flavefaciens]